MANFFNNSHLICSVRRDHLVEDTLTFIQCVPDFRDFKKPLKVKFDGEEADDAGGVRKEFFLLLLKEILDPKYGMFKEYEETHAIWFHPNCFEDIGYFFMIGVLCGLAIYNFTIIYLPFPLALYKKLLGDEVSKEPLKTHRQISVLSSKQNQYECDKPNHFKFPAILFNILKIHFSPI